MGGTHRSHLGTTNREAVGILAACGGEDVPKYSIMFTLLGCGFRTCPAMSDFENPIFDVEVSDVEKRRCKVSNYD